MKPYWQPEPISVKVELTAIETIRRWDGDDRPLHCQNCRYAIVGGGWPRPMVHCEKDRGKRKTLALISMIRPRGSGFATAADCEDFDSMADDR